MTSKAASPAGTWTWTWKRCFGGQGKARRYPLLPRVFEPHSWWGACVCPSLGVAGSAELVLSGMYGSGSTSHPATLQRGVVTDPGPWAA